MRKGNTVSSYIATLGLSAQSFLRFTPRQTCSINYHFISLGDMQPQYDYCTKITHIQNYTTTTGKT